MPLRTKIYAIFGLLPIVKKYIHFYVSQRSETVLRKLAYIFVKNGIFSLKLAYAITDLYQNMAELKLYFYI